MLEYAWLIVILPLLSFLICALFGRWISEGGAPVVVGALGGSLALSLYLLYEVMGKGAVGHIVQEVVPGYIWIPGVESMRLGILVDNLSALMLVLVSFLSLLIAIYSIGYMHEEEGKPRYYAEISLFVAGMLGTVSADNFLQLLIFWEIMGLCSYLLIGFWYTKPSAASAAKKAFLVTRVGDVLFLLGVIVIWNVFGTFSFEEISSRMPDAWSSGLLTPQLVTLLPLLLFGGAVGKSAQFPLHVWLPDAMEGPTTVSALIHAATMVKAGVYLTARSFIFLVPPAGVEAPETAIIIVAIIGGFTALFAATHALAAYDIKRVLAYSTISQLGYMFLGLGVGAFFLNNGHGSEGYSAALYHLTNHAFFKALMFLSAGSVIHAVHTNDMREMGGLASHMKITSTAMLFGALALSGIVPFSGFWSKDEILAVTFESGMENSVFLVLYVAGLVTAFMTAFYAFRMWLMTFRGSYRGQGHPHESPSVMTGPLIVLSVFALISGMMFFTIEGFGNFIGFEELESKTILEIFTSTFNPMRLTGVLAWLSLLMAFGGVGLAWAVYEVKSLPADRFTSSRSGAFLHKMLSNRYWIDDVYNAFALRVTYGFARVADWFDRKVIDGVVNGIGYATVAMARGSDFFDRRVVDGIVNGISLKTVRSSLALRQRQSGSVQSYAWVYLMGAAMIIVFILLLRFVLRGI